MKRFCCNCGKENKKTTGHFSTGHFCSFACETNYHFQTKEKEKLNCGVCGKSIVKNNYITSGNNYYHFLCYHSWLKKQIENLKNYYNKYLKLKEDFKILEEECSNKLVSEAL